MNLFLFKFYPPAMGREKDPHNYQPASEWVMLPFRIQPRAEPDKGTTHEDADLISESSHNRLSGGDAGMPSFGWSR